MERETENLGIAVREAEKNIESRLKQTDPEMEDSAGCVRKLVEA